MISIICIFPPDSTDFSNNGSGPLSPTSAIVTETLNGAYELELVHPIDETGKWRRLAEDRILRAPVPAAMTPRVHLIADIPGSATMIYRVNTGGDRLRLRAGPSTNDTTLGYYAPGTEVVVIEKTSSEWYEVACPDGKRGYMYAGNLAHARTETTPGAAINQIVEPSQVRDQLFRIYRVAPELDKITVYARHIFYDLMDNMIQSYKPSANALGASVVLEIGENCLSDHRFSFHSDLESTAEDVEFNNVNPVEALLGEEGVVERYGGELARDWYDVYVVKRVGSDTGVQIREGKNLLGISYDVDLTNVTTRIMPTGEDADGNILYLPELYVDSPNAGNYPHIKWLHMPVEEAKEVLKGNASELKTKEQCYAEMRRAAQDAFSNGCDLPTVTLDVDFVSCADTEEYRQYGFLQAVFLGDTVRVIAPRVGVWVSMRVTQYTYDCLTEKYAGMTLGSVADTLAGNMISARQLPSGMISGAKLAINSVGAGQLRSGSVGALQVQQAAIQTAHIEDASITRAKVAEALIETLNVNAVTAVRADIRQLTAGEITTDQLYADLAAIAVAQLTTAHIQSAQINWADVVALTTEVARLAKAEITTANIVDADIDWARINTLKAEVGSLARAELTTANIREANISWADIASLNAVIADVARARIREASITIAQISDLRAEIARVVTLAAQDGRFNFASVRDLVSSAMVLEEGVAGTVFIKNLVATQANFVSATLGKLVLRGSDENYYSVTVQADGTIHTEPVSVDAEEITDGETSDGRSVVSTTANIASLNASDIKAESAVIGGILAGALRAGKISVSEAFLASAVIPELYATTIKAMGDTLDITANESVRIVVSRAASPVVNLTRDSFIVPCDKDGNHCDYSGCVSTLSVYHNGVDVTADCAISVTAGESLLWINGSEAQSGQGDAILLQTGQVTGLWDAGRYTYTVTGLAGDAGSVRFNVTYNGMTVSKELVVAKGRGAQNLNVGGRNLIRNSDTLLFPDYTFD